MTLDELVAALQALQNESRTKIKVVVSMQNCGEPCQDQRAIQKVTVALHPLFGEYIEILLR